MSDKAFIARVKKITDPYKLLDVIATEMCYMVDGYYRSLTNAMLNQAELLVKEHKKEKRREARQRTKARPYSTHPTGGE